MIRFVHLICVLAALTFLIFLFHTYRAYLHWRYVTPSLLTLELDQMKENNINVPDAYISFQPNFQPNQVQIGNETILIWICTIATQPHFNLSSLLQDASSRGLYMYVCGLERPWREWGFGIKLFYQEQICRYISKNYKDEQRKLVLFTDAYDIVLSTFSLETLVQKYLNFNSPIVFAAEKWCYPDPTACDHYTTKNQLFPYLNSGVLLGEVHSLLSHFSPSCYDVSTDDQKFWTWRYLQNPTSITLDHQAQLFLCVEQLQFMKDYGMDYFSHKWWCTFTHTEPCIIHFHGTNGKKLMPWVLALKALSV